jgi:hypothetical protein
MTFEGFYRITFTGRAGSGFGILVLDRGNMAGADVAGSLYDGTYTEDPEGDSFHFQITMNAPAGITPVQTGIPIAAPLMLPFNGAVRRADIGSPVPTLVQTPLGPVNVLFQKIRGLT